MASQPFGASLPSPTDARQRQNEIGVCGAAPRARSTATPASADMDEHSKLVKQREALPIAAHKQELLDTYKSAQVIILSSETGSGKTTQVPQYIVSQEWAGEKQVTCTQPRRLAATSVAARVAQEMNVQLGQEVGARVRFEDLTSENTRLVYMTDGMLLREAMTDKLLSNYSCIIVDEAHERTMPTDLVLGLLKGSMASRPDLKVIIMSATMNSNKFREFLPHAAMVQLGGRSHPVEIYYLKTATPNYLACALHLAKYIHENMPAGDILIFLTTVVEIERACSLLRDEVQDMEVVPLYSNLSSEEQSRVFGPSSNRRCVISTNVAETSVTIDGIVYVIDSGLVMRSTYNPRAGLKSLTTEPISKAAAVQRAGRAGRTRPGICFRLYQKECFEESFIPSTPPGVLQNEMTGQLLLLKAMGYANIKSFDFIDPPHPEVYLRALEDLYALHLINKSGNVTEDGLRVARIPTNPSWGVSLLEAHRLGCSLDVMSLAAMAEMNRPIFRRPYDQRKVADIAHTRFASPLSDHLTRLNALHAYITTKKQGVINMEEWCTDAFVDAEAVETALDIRDALQRVAEDLLHGPLRAATDDGTSVRRAIARGFYHKLACRNESMPQDVYRTIHDDYPAAIHPESALIEAEQHWIVYNDFILLSKPYLQTVTAIDIGWLANLEYFRDNNYPRDPETGGYRQADVRKQFKLARAREEARRVDEAMMTDTSSSDPSSSSEDKDTHDADEWVEWIHPGRPDDGITERDIRHVPTITDIRRIDEPYLETQGLFPRGIKISRKCDGLDWYVGQTLTSDKSDDKSDDDSDDKCQEVAPISFERKFRLPGQTGEDLSSATHRGHISKIRRPAGVGAGWGDHDLFREWQIHGRQVRRYMVRKTRWTSRFGERITFVPEGDADVVEFDPYMGCFEETQPEYEPKSISAKFR